MKKMMLAAGAALGLALVACHKDEEMKVESVEEITRQMDSISAANASLPQAPRDTAYERVAKDVAYANGKRYIRNPVKLNKPGSNFSKYDKFLGKVGMMAGFPYDFSKFKLITMRFAPDGSEDLKCAIRAVLPQDADSACDEAAGFSDYWKVIYFKEIDQTWLIRVVAYPEKESSVYINKVAKGRRPNLNME